MIWSIPNYLEILPYSCLSQYNRTYLQGIVDPYARDVATVQLRDLSLLSKLQFLHS